MGYQLLADENIERATVNYLRKLDHDVERVGNGADLEFGASDAAIAEYARQSDRLILTQDDDFFTQLDVNRTAGVLFQRDQTLSAREVGDVVHELSQYLEQDEITLEYVSRTWL